MPSSSGAPGSSGFGGWIGRSRQLSETLTLERARKLAATLDLAPEGLRSGDTLPPGWHWIYFHEPVARSRLAEDGHEMKGDFLPPIPLERRMWAGGRLHFFRPLCIDDELSRVSTIRSIEEKEGRTGPLVFVTVEHRFLDDAGVALQEEQDLVYLNRSRPHLEGDPSPASASPAADGGRAKRFTADEITLFRFSALTFNAHRIHYDLRYALETEGYPDLVVHGPLLALLLLDAGTRWMDDDDEGEPMSDRTAVFSYRALRPLFCGETVELIGERSQGSRDGRILQLCARRPDGTTSMRASLTMMP